MRFLVVFLIALFAFGCAYSRHMNEGDKAFAAGEWEAALTQYEAALVVDPNSTEAQEKASQARENAIGTYREEVVAKLMAEDVLGAMNVAARLHEKFPDVEAATAIVMEVKNATFGKAQGLLNERDFANALMLYDSAAEYLPPAREDARAQSQAVKSKWVADLEAAGTTAEEAGRRGDAALHWAKLVQLTREPKYETRFRAQRTALLEEYRYRVEVDGRSGAGLDAIRQRLDTLNGQSALRVMQDPPRGAELDATAKFTVRAPKFRTTKSERTETVRYQSGTQQVPNPFYDMRQDDLLKEQERLTSRENDVTRLEADVDRYRAAVAKEGDTPNTTTGAEQSLSNAESRLESARRSLQDQRNAVQRAREEVADTPQTKEEPVYSDHTYTIVRHDLTGELPFEGSIRHRDSRPTASAKTVVKTSATDETHPAQPVADVPADPLTLPSEGELAAQLYELAANEARTLVVESFEGWRAAILEKAAKSSEDVKVDLLVAYILTDPRSVPPTVAADLSALRGIPDAVRVLSQ